MVSEYYHENIVKVSDRIDPRTGKVIPASQILAMEIAINPSFQKYAPVVGVVFLIVALVFVWRTFYAMRIPERKD